MNCKNYEPVEEHTGCSGCKSTLPFPECVRSCVDDTTGIRRNWTPAQPEPAAPDSHADLRQHCFGCAKFLDCDHYCAPTAGCFVAMEPPAPDTSNGVWFESNGKWQYQGQDFRHDLTAIMVKGEKFVREDRSKKPQADAWTEVLMACYNLGMETDVKSLTGLVSVLNFIHALYENAELVRRLAKWSRHRSGLIDPDVEDEFHAIENEAVRLHPETKGE